MWTNNCGVVRIPHKVTGIDAIPVMIKEIEAISLKKFGNHFDKVIVEVPSFIPWMSSGILPMATISGACIALFGASNEQDVLPIYPSMWNASQKKEKTAYTVQEILGLAKTWHFEQQPKRESDIEHVIDAAGMAYWWIEKTYFT